MAATYTVKQVAEILGYSTNSIYTFLKERRIKGVRVGRGRFRIPQSELDRLLLANKGAGSATVSAQAMTPILKELMAMPQQSAQERGAAGGIPEPAHEPLLVTLANGTGVHKVDVPSLFDWFTGISAVILGLSMFLFSRMFEEFSVASYVMWVPAIRTMLLAGGLGLLLTDVVGRKWSTWHRFFHIVCLVAYGWFAVILWQIHDFEGVVIFGTLAILLLVNFFVALGGIASFAIYVVAFLGFLPAAALASAQKSSISAIISFVALPSQVVAYVWLGLVLAIAFVLFLGYNQHRKVFWIGMMAVAALVIALSLHYAENLYWGRSLFILQVGLLSLIMPIWDLLTFTHKRDRAFVFSVFGMILLLFLGTVGMLRVLQTNIIQYAERELGNKVIYGKTFLESALDQAQSALIATSQNSIFVTALKSEDSQGLAGLSRGLFETNNNLKRVVVVNKTGDVVTAYPYGVSEKGNISARDYVAQALATQKPYMTVISETQPDNTRQDEIVVAVPVFSTEESVMGVLVGMMDLEELGAKLQQVASSENDEHFTVIDKNAKRVIQQDRSLIGVEVDQGDEVRLGLSGQHGQTQGYTADGIRSIIAYDGIDPVGWGIAVKAPMATVLHATNAASIMIFSLIIISMLIIGVLLLGYRLRTTVPPASFDATESASGRTNRTAETLAAMKKKRPRIRGDSS